MARAQMPSLRPEIPGDRLAFIIEKARQFDVKVDESDPDSGSNPADDGQTDILEDRADDPTREELVSALADLNDDQRIELIALAWIGRGTYLCAEWREAVATARSEHGRRAESIRYLLGLPLLADYIEDGLAQFGDGIVDDDATEGVNADGAPLGNMPDHARGSRAFTNPGS